MGKPVLSTRIKRVVLRQTSDYGLTSDQWTKMQWDFPVEDKDGLADLPNNRIKAPDVGFWHVSAFGAIATNGGNGGNLRIRLLVNGAAQYTTELFNTNVPSSSPGFPLCGARHLYVSNPDAWLTAEIWWSRTNGYVDASKGVDEGARFVVSYMGK